MGALASASLVKLMDGVATELSMHQHDAANQNQSSQLKCLDCGTNLTGITTWEPVIHLLFTGTRMHGALCFACIAAIEPPY